MWRNSLKRVANRRFVLRTFKPQAKSEERLRAVPIAEFLNSGKSIELQNFIRQFSVILSNVPRGFERFYQKDKPKQDTEDTKQKGDDNKDNKNDNKNKTPKQFSDEQMIVTLAAAFGMGLFMWWKSEPDTMTFQELYSEFLSKGYVDRLVIVNKKMVRVHIRGDAPAEHANAVYLMQIGSAESFEGRVETAQMGLGIGPKDFIPVQYVNEVDWWEEVLRMLPGLIFMLPMLFFARNLGMGSGGPMGKIGKAFPTGVKDLKSKVKFSDVAGMHAAKKEVVEFVDFLKDPKKYEMLGARIPKGGLLVGPPGTGKTLLAKAVAGEANRPFFSMSGSDFIEMFVGVGPSRVRDLFAQARKNAPAIIFIDEIDAVGRARGKGGFAGGNDERENTLNQMLVEMDGFASSSGIVVLAGTNRADILDQALLRPGRFDRQIQIDKPDLPEREEIFNVHMRKIKIDESIEKKEVSRRMAALTPGFSGADIANICNEAAIFAARRVSKFVAMQDFEAAAERVMGGLPRNTALTPEQKSTVAFHESGHAIAGWFLKHADPLLKVSIVPRASGALGFAQYLPAEMSLYPKEALLDKIAVLLAGRAAEELFVGAISTGAGDDLKKVTGIAYGMVQLYGMAPEIGLLSYQQDEQTFTKPFSESKAQLIDEIAKKIVDEQYERVKQLLLEKTDLMNALKERLFAKETLVVADLEEVLGQRPFAVGEEFKKFVEARVDSRESPEVVQAKPEENLTESSGIKSSPVV